MATPDADVRALIRTPRRRLPAGLVLGAMHVAAMGAAVWAWHNGWWPVCVVLWGLLIWLNHGALTQLHEAAHGTLSSVRWVNETLGVVIGTASLIPLGVYRYVHARHHAHLGGELDPEFWPYNRPGAPRWLRIGYAWAELLAGWPLTPMLYSVRTVRSWRLVPPRHRRRITAEWLLIVLAWGGAFAVVARMGWWPGFIVAFLVPAWGAGTFQTIRKFTEHLGMHGTTVLSMTRTVAYERWLGRAASRTQLHVSHHGTHHRYARIPFRDLPRATTVVYGEPGAGPVFRSHLAAMLDMAPHLLDPKVGPQWRSEHTGPSRVS